MAHLLYYDQAASVFRKYIGRSSYVLPYSVSFRSPSQKHVKCKEYSSLSDFAEDVELVFSNAMSFNQEHTQIWEDALSLRVR